MKKALAFALVLFWGTRLGAEVQVREGTLDLPTDEEGPPDVNPPFDLFVTKFNYPYSLRDNITGRQTVVRYQTLELENEHLKLVVLPDLGGHLYTCVDKSNGAEMFYANRSIRKAQIGYRGAWAAYGIEFNFPVSHNWASMSPVDFATTQNADGSASIWVANVDRVYGMQWRVELRLAPGSAVLEQHVALYNPSPVRHRFYWWNNAAVRVHDDSRIHYPMRFTASHGFTEVGTWPVNARGRDLSIVGNHLDGPVSLFSHGSREAFMGVYHPWSQAGVAHYSSPEDAPTKKIWSFGGDADGIDWRRALSDDGSAYVEVQAGLFRNQETYGFLEPQESIRFVEYWMPVRGIGGITRANPEAVVQVDRKAGKAGTVDLSFGVNVNRTVRGGRLRLKDGARLVHEEPLDLTPAESLVRVRAGLEATPRYTLEVIGGDGHVLLAHTEEAWDYVPDSEIRLGPQPSAKVTAPDERTDGDLVSLGDTQEREGRLLDAWATYRQGLARFPESLGLLRAAGRLAVALKRPDEATSLLGRALARVSNDPEVQHYLGLSRDAMGDTAKARVAFEGAQILPPFRAASRLELASLDARGGGKEAALLRVRALLDESPDALRAGGWEVALLRRLGRSDEARTRLAHWQSLDPTSNLLRHEAVALGGADSSLWLHLAADPERVLDVAEDYMRLGLFDDAVALLDRRYPQGEGVRAEAGTPVPQDHPLIAYYRGYCRERSGGSGAADYAAASVLATRYVFPNRAGTLQGVAGRSRREPEGCHCALSPGVPAPLGRARGRSHRGLGGDGPAQPRHPGSPPEPGPGPSPRAKRPEGRPRGVPRRHPRGRGQHGPLRRRRSGAEPARSAHRRTHRDAPALSRQGRNASAPGREARAGPGRGGPRRGGRGALRLAILPPGRERHERATGLPRGAPASGHGSGPGRSGHRSRGHPGGPREAGAWARLHP